MNNLSERNKFVEDNVGLVHMIARKFIGRGVDYEDIVQIGSIGLIKAAERFDFNRNIKFSTYAVSLIIGEIKRFFRDDGMIKIPRNIKEIGVKVVKAADEIRKLHHREATIDELSKKLNVDTEVIVEAIEAMQPCESLYAEYDNSACFCDKIACENEFGENIENSIFLKEILEYLDERMRKNNNVKIFQR